jgi:uncharacterized protein YdaU (DUF1376 family)
MLDLYYTKEKPLPLEIKKIARFIGLNENQNEIEQVLSDFFERSDSGWSQKRVVEEIAKYNSKSKIARTNGKKGGRPKLTQSVNLANPTLTQSVNLANPTLTQSVNLANPTLTQSVNLANPTLTQKKPDRKLTINHKPRTINQEPETKSKSKSKSTPLSDKPDERVREIFDFWCYVMKKGSRTKLLASRRSAIKSRLKDGYTIDEIKQAITNCSLSVFHMGSDGKGKYNELELICRSSKFENFRDNVGKEKSAKGAGISKGNDCGYDEVDYQSGATKEEDYPEWMQN